jgi:large subunit ribosomal protein L13
MRTSTPKASAPGWLIVDAKDQTLGRLSTRLAHVLRGKHKVDWSPHQIHSDHIIVINADKVVLHGNKAEQKEYITHSGYFGSLKRTPFSRLFAKNPSKVISHAVSGMLPRNKLRPLMMKHIHIYAGEDHPHEAQQPQPFDSIK